MVQKWQPVIDMGEISFNSKFQQGSENSATIYPDDIQTL